MPRWHYLFCRGGAKDFLLCQSFVLQNTSTPKMYLKISKYKIWWKNWIFSVEVNIEPKSGHWYANTHGKDGDELPWPALPAPLWRHATVGNGVHNLEGAFHCQSLNWWWKFASRGGAKFFQPLWISEIAFSQHTPGREANLGMNRSAGILRSSLLTGMPLLQCCSVNFEPDLTK